MYQNLRLPIVSRLQSCPLELVYIGPPTLVVRILRLQKKGRVKEERLWLLVSKNLPTMFVSFSSLFFPCLLFGSSSRILKVLQSCHWCSSFFSLYCLSFLFPAFIHGWRLFLCTSLDFPCFLDLFSLFLPKMSSEDKSHLINNISKLQGSQASSSSEGNPKSLGRVETHPP